MTTAMDRESTHLLLAAGRASHIPHNNNQRHPGRGSEKGRTYSRTVLARITAGLLAASALLVLVWTYRDSLGLHLRLNRLSHVSPMRRGGHQLPDRPSTVVAGVILERNGRYRVVDAGDPRILASATFTRNVSGSGWHSLDAHVVSSRVSDARSYVAGMTALGYVEGYVTCQEMQEFYANFYSGLFDGGDPSDETLDFLRDNHEWVSAQAERHSGSSDYWFTVRGVLAQLDGMLQGVIDGCSMNDADRRKAEKDDITGLEFLSSLDRPSILNLLLINANGDLYQIADKFNDFNGDSFQKPRDDDYHKKKDKGDAGGEGKKRRRRRLDSTAGGAATDRRARRRRGRREDHCSALVKLLPDLSDVVFGHATWDDYQCMAPRVIKTYTLPMTRSAARPSNETFTVHFSSSPALLSSVDDFYLIRRTNSTTSTGDTNTNTNTNDNSHQHLVSLAVLETTIDMYNPALLELISPSSVLSWLRARVSNQLADSGADWPRLFAQHPSGTYDNQWLVLDLRLFRPGQVPPAGFLHVLEEVPGRIHSEDLSRRLQTPAPNLAFWASYNQPYFSDISELSGNLAACQEDPALCYATDPRALIFEARQAGVTSLHALQTLLGYNQFLTDPSSKRDACSAIACREDLLLDVGGRYPFGATDGKVSSALLATRAAGGPAMLARLGPSNDDQPTFCWSAFERSRGSSGGKERGNRAFSHQGHQDCFNNTWQLFPPNKPTSST